MRKHIEFLNDESVHKLQPEAKKLLENGFIYLYGRDKQFRPIIILDATKINLKKVIIIFY
jgi:hypothetical protein